MPLYGFACKNCHSSFETLVRGDDVPVCPSCGGKKLEQQLARIAKPAAGGPQDAPACAMESGGQPCGACPAMAGMCEPA